MKNIPLLLVIFLSLLLSGMAQEREIRDYRAELDLQGGFPVFAFAPDGACWLTSGHGRVYYTGDIHSDWHCASPLFFKNDSTCIETEHLVFLDTSIAIVATYDHDLFGHSDDGGLYYRTDDRGKSWTRLRVGEPVHLRHICNDSQGHVWIAGCGYNDILYFSEDKGKTFTFRKLPIKFDDWADVTALDMRDGRYGLAGVNIKHDTFPFLLTEDNWHTSKRIPTPLGDGKEINKVLIWNDLWVIRQGREVYYSSSQNLQWQRFPVKVTDFYPDRERGHLIAITDNLDVVDLSSPTDYRPIHRHTRWQFAAVANLRGGGEYGREWHKSGTKMKKQHVFDDCIAVAIPQVGVMDMLRYHKFTIGRYWAVDYGTSEDSKEMFEYLYKYSPLHAIQSGVEYPAILATTADHDDRVVPAHSFKYAAALQNSDIGNKPHLIRIERNAGHDGGKPLDKTIDETVDIYSFIFFNMNVEPRY